MIFISAIHLDRDRSPARLRDGRGRLRAGAGRARRCCGPRSRSSPSSTARPGSSSAQRRARAARGASAPPSSKPRPRGCCESEQRRSLALAAGRWARGTGTSITGECMWDEGPASHLRRRARTIRRHAREHPGADPSRGLGAICRPASNACLSEAQPHAGRVPRRAPERRGALVHWARRRRRLDAHGSGRAHQRRHDRHHRRKEAEERQALLAREVDHRAKNALASCNRSSG